MAKIKALRQTHPKYHLERLDTVAALYEGGAQWDERKPHLFPKHAAEMADVWGERQAQAAYFNHLGGLLSLLVGHLFSEPTELEGGGGYWADVLKDSADGVGTSWDHWWAKALLDALKHRQAFALVNIPGKDEAAEEAPNLAAQQASGETDAYLTLISGREAIDWGEDSRGRLTWLMREQVTYVRRGPGEMARPLWTWTEYRADAITTWTWTDPKLDTPPWEAEAVEAATVAHGYGLPVVRLDLDNGLAMGDKLHDPALRLTRSENDLDWALYQAAHALLWIKDDWGDTDNPVLGPGYHLRLGADAEIGYVEPTGANFAILRERVKDLREELYRVVQAMAQGLDGSASRSSQSGESKGMDWKASEVMLSAYAATVLDAMKRTADVVGAARSGTAAPVISGLHTGEDEGTDSFLARAAMALDARAMSPLFRKTVAKREVSRILGDEVDRETITAILEEIDGAVVEEAGVFTPTEDLPAQEETEETEETGGGDTIAESDVEPLNGAQMSSAKGIVVDVGAGIIPRETGIQMLIEFLGIDKARAERIMGKVGQGFKPAGGGDGGANKNPNR